jgi:hypothetical protein
VLGGRLEEGRILRDTYLPFRIGERVLLFVQLNGTDDFPFVGFHQGILRFRGRNPNGTMPDLDAPDTGNTAQIVVDGRNHLLLRFNQGFLNTIPYSEFPQFRVVVGPGQATVPPEPNVPSGGVIPMGTPIPSTIATPNTVRTAIRNALTALGLPSNPPPLGDPSQPLADQLVPNQPIVRCGIPAQLSDEPEAFEPVPGGEIDPPIEPGPDERMVHQ